MSAAANAIGIMVRVDGYRIESSDYSVSRLLTYKCQQSSPDYSTKPPSSWTSTSRCIQLYGPIASLEVGPTPLAWMVSPSLPGAIACRCLPCVSPLTNRIGGPLAATRLTYLTAVARDPTLDHAESISYPRGIATFRLRAGPFAFLTRSVLIAADEIQLAR